MRIQKTFLTAITILLTIAYPFIIWLGNGRIEPRWLAVLLLALVLTRLPALKLSRLTQCIFFFGICMVIGAIWTNALLPLQLYPVLVNLGFLIAFSYSLTTSQSMVERFARMSEPELPVSAVYYTRRVTQVWCVFFIFNGSVAFATAMWASQEIWSLYTGFISYLLIGLLFAIEYLYRIRFKRRHNA